MPHSPTPLLVQYSDNYDNKGGYGSNHKGEGGRGINDQKCYKKITLPVAQLFLVLIQQPTLLTDDFHFLASTVVLI